MKLTFIPPNLGAKTTQETIDNLLKNGKSMLKILEPFLDLDGINFKNVKMLEHSGEEFINYLSKSREFKKIL